MKRLQSLTITLLSIAFVTAFWCERRAQRDLRTENQKLEHLIEQWTGFNPAPKIEADAESQIVSPSKEASYRELLRLRGEVALLRRQKEERDRLCTENQQLRSNLLARVLSCDSRLSSAQIESFLKTKGRTSESLLAASRLTDDKAFLQEAITKYPNDAKVHRAAATAQEFSAERRHWLDAFKESAPDNALANYLSAQDYFKFGQTNLALQEMTIAAGKPKMEDYSAELFRNAEDVYSFAGYPDGAAKAAAWNSSRDSSVNDLMKLQRVLIQLANGHNRAGDSVSAQGLLQIDLRLGQRLADEPFGLKTETQEATGLVMQRRLLETMAPTSRWDETGQTVKERLDELAHRRAEINKFTDPPAWDGYLLKTLSEQDLITYFDRLQNAGETEARKWAASRAH